MKNEAQVRLLVLLQYLYKETDEKHPVSAQNILKHWESRGIKASRKSVYKDITLLADFGIDIVCVKSTQNLYFIGSRLFELPELKLLVNAVESSRFITPKKSRLLIQKLGRLSSSAQAAQLKCPIYMDGMPKPKNEAIYYIVDLLQTAIQENKQISFQYYEYLPTKETVLKHRGYRYQFSPYALIWNRDFYYVVGWSEKHNKIAQFRVDRMTGVELLDLPARQTQEFDPTVYGQKVFGMYPDDLQMVTLLCANHLMRSVIDQFGEEVQTKTADDGHFLATVEVAPSPPFFGWVFTFAGEIRIVSPENVLEEMREMAAWLQ
jgi:predicted DNA-binding transcriptional regulator YafY